jgi:CBS domain-containing protein
MSTVRTILEHKGNSFWYIDPFATVAAAVQRLSEKKIGALVVMEGDRLVGIFSERDLVRLLAQHGPACLDRQVGDVMTSPVHCVGLGTTVDECMALMTGKQIRHLPVVEGKEVMGVVSNRDVVQEAISNRESLLTGIDVLAANHQFPT